VRRKLVVVAVVATAGLLRPHSGAPAAPLGEQCVTTDPVVVVGMTILPAQQQCVPVP
jgi:hypothetical protein